MAIYKLKDVGKWSCNKFISSNFFVSTDNMKGSEILEQKYGVGKEFKAGGILLSNIRPYFKKVWFATCVGAHSGDVLNFIVNQNIVLEKYIFFILSSKNFNVFWNRTSKGTKMPRGDKNSMLNYKINIPSINEQQKIIDIIEPHEKLFLSYSNCVKIDNIDDATHDINQLINIIEPMEMIEKQIQKIKKLIIIAEQLLINRLYDLTSNTKKLGDFISISSEKEFSKNVKTVGVGYDGFTVKRGKVAEKSKIVKYSSLVIGLISKKIPMGINYSHETYGVSTAYKVFTSSASIFTLIGKTILYNNWKRFVIPTSRQGQGFDHKAFLNVDIPDLSEELIKKKSQMLNNLWRIKLDFENLHQSTIKQKESLIDYFIK